MKKLLVFLVVAVLFSCSSNTSDKQNKIDKLNEIVNTAIELQYKTRNALAGANYHLKLAENHRLAAELEIVKTKNLLKEFESVEDSERKRTTVTTLELLISTAEGLISHNRKQEDEFKEKIVSLEQLNQSFGNIIKYTENSRHVL